MCLIKKTLGLIVLLTLDLRLATSVAGGLNDKSISNRELPNQFLPNPPDENGNLLEPSTYILLESINGKGHFLACGADGPAMDFTRNCWMFSYKQVLTSFIFNNEYTVHIKI